jgi:regulator of nucleoside diphosphate kinase
MLSILSSRGSPPAAAPWRTVTELDRARIHRWLRGQPPSANDRGLIELVDNADEVPSRQIPGDVVTMYSQVLLTGAGNKEDRKLTLCYPSDAEPMTGFVSVFSPVGVALLGRRVGEDVTWAGPDGRLESARVEALLFQPEASGDFTL